MLQFVFVSMIVLGMEPFYKLIIINPRTIQSILGDPVGGWLEHVSSTASIPGLDKASTSWSTIDISIGVPIGPKDRHRMESRSDSAIPQLLASTIQFSRRDPSVNEMEKCIEGLYMTSAHLCLCHIQDMLNPSLPSIGSASALHVYSLSNDNLLLRSTHVTLPHPELTHLNCLDSCQTHSCHEPAPFDSYSTPAPPSES